MECLRFIDPLFGSLLTPTSYDVIKNKKKGEGEVSCYCLKGCGLSLSLSLSLSHLLLLNAV